MSCTWVVGASAALCRRVAPAAEILTRRVRTALGIARRRPVHGILTSTDLLLRLHACSNKLSITFDDHSQPDYRVEKLFMSVLCNRTGHYIFALWFLLSSFFSFFPRLISAVADCMSTILHTHGVVLVRI